MPAVTKSFQDYLRAIEKELATAKATEHTYRPALIDLLKACGAGLTVINEPQHIEAGAPDILVQQGSVNQGYVETKDIGISLDNAEKSEQVKRYLEALPNLIITDYLEFRWYKDSKRELKAIVGTVDNAGKIKRDKQGAEELAKLFTEFLSYNAPGVGTPKELAVRMARLAHRIREGAEEALNKNIASDLLSGLYKAFQETLIPGLEIRVFADMYAQTIAYGLFAARCETDKPQDFSRQQAAYLIPKTNPFLKALFEQITGTALDDEPYKWAVDELVQLLKKADMAEVLKNFGKGTGKDDPVVYFYEDFLRAYDKKISQMRGVYYTPIPVVSYIIRSIDYLLKNNFSRPQGLSDEDTYILDPATGTGTFLYAVINEIYEAMSKQGQIGKWDGYVAEHLLPRIFGFELLMAPYVIAHLKLGLQLKNSGYKFQSKERLGVFLTNTLDEAVKSSQMLMAQYIVKEANAAAEVKKEKPIMVVLGNPPYSVSSSNKSEYIEKLMETYKTAVRQQKNIQPLSDDYIKFIRFAQERVHQTGYGIVAMITNHSYLSGLVHRGMREKLIEDFSEIYLLDLHGSSKLGEKSPDGAKDENVFDIQQGVAIGFFIKRPFKTKETKVYHADLWGLQKDKYAALSSSDISLTSWKELKPTPPYFFFTVKEFNLESEYKQYETLSNIFQSSATGVGTGKDEAFVQFSEKELSQLKMDLINTTLSDEFIKERYGIQDTSGWHFNLRRKALIKNVVMGNDIISYFYRPFDVRFVFYNPILRRDQRIFMQNLLRPNLAMLTCQQQSIIIGFHHIFCTSYVVDESAVSNRTRERDFVFPLYLYPSEQEIKSGLYKPDERRPNLNPDFIKDFSGKLGLKFIEDGKGNLKETFGPEDVFNYAYAVFHSPTYRTRYAEFLKIDFPRLPLTSDVGLFKALCEKGAELVSWHLLTNPALSTLRSQVKYNIPGSNIVEKVSYDEKMQRVRINKTQYFEGITPDVWNFHIGGYQVCEKWLKDRLKDHRTLSYEDQSHYQDIVIALKETLRLMNEIDAVIPGWPLE